MKDKIVEYSIKDIKVKVRAFNEEEAIKKTHKLVSYQRNHAEIVKIEEVIE